MLTPFVTGLFALAGVGFGVMLEPIRARVARRSRVLEERSLRCARLIEATGMSRSRVLWLFRAHRRPLEGQVPMTPTEIRDITEEYWASRNELRQAVLLVQLSGPTELADQATIVLDTEQKMRLAWFAENVAISEHNAEPSEELWEVVHQFEAAVKQFTRLARKNTQ
jgi:hypothetical protein